MGAVGTSGAMRLEGAIGPTQAARTMGIVGAASAMGETGLAGVTRRNRVVGASGVVSLPELLWQAGPTRVMSTMRNVEGAGNIGPSGLHNEGYNCLNEAERILSEGWNATCWSDTKHALKAMFDLLHEQHEQHEATERRMNELVKNSKCTYNKFMVALNSLCKNFEEPEHSNTILANAEQFRFTFVRVQGPSCREGKLCQIFHLKLEDLNKGQIENYFWPIEALAIWAGQSLLNANVKSLAQKINNFVNRSLDMHEIVTLGGTLYSDIKEIANSSKFSRGCFRGRLKRFVTLSGMVKLVQLLLRNSLIDSFDFERIQWIKKIGSDDGPQALATDLWDVPAMNWLHN